MDDNRIVGFERALWVGEADVYRRCVSRDCLMVVPAQPFLLRGEEAISSVENTPRWDSVDFAEFEIRRPQEGLIVVGYSVDASRGEAVQRLLHLNVPAGWRARLESDPAPTDARSCSASCRGRAWLAVTPRRIADFRVARALAEDEEYSPTSSSIDEWIDQAEERVWFPRRLAVGG